MSLNQKSINNTAPSTSNISSSTLTVNGIDVGSTLTTLNSSVAILSSTVTGDDASITAISNTINNMPQLTTANTFTGANTFSGVSNLNGSVVMGTSGSANTLTVNENTTFNNSITATSDIIANGNVTIGASNDTTHTLTVNESTQINNNVTIGNNHTLTVNGGTILSGTTVVSGQMNVDGAQIIRCPLAGQPFFLQFADVNYNPLIELGTDYYNNYALSNYANTGFVFRNSNTNNILTISNGGNLVANGTLTSTGVITNGNMSVSGNVVLGATNDTSHSLTINEKNTYINGDVLSNGNFAIGSDTNNANNFTVNSWTNLWNTTLFGKDDFSDTTHGVASYLPFSMLKDVNIGNPNSTYWMTVNEYTRLFNSVSIGDSGDTTHNFIVNENTSLNNNVTVGATNDSTHLLLVNEQTQLNNFVTIGVQNDTTHNLTVNMASNFTQTPTSSSAPVNASDLVNKAYSDKNKYKTDRVVFASAIYTQIGTGLVASTGFIYPNLTTTNTTYLYFNPTNSSSSGSSTTNSQRNLTPIMLECSLEITGAYSHSIVPTNNSTTAPRQSGVIVPVTASAQLNYWHGVYSLLPVQNPTPGGTPALYITPVSVSASQSNNKTNLFASCNYLQTNLTLATVNSTYTPTSVAFTPLSASLDSANNRIVITTGLPNVVAVTGTNAYTNGGYVCAYHMSMRIINGPSSTVPLTGQNPITAFYPESSASNIVSQGGYCYFSSV